MLLLASFSAITLAISIAYYYFLRESKFQATDFPDTKWSSSTFWIISLLFFRKPPGSMTFSAYVFQCLMGFCKVFEEMGIFSIRRGAKNILVICSPEKAAEVLNEKTYIAKSTTYDFGRLAMGDGLAMTKSNDYWKLHRRVVSPSFSLKGATVFYDCMNKHATELLQEIHRNNGNEAAIDILSLTSKCTFDILIDSLLSSSEDMGDDLKQYIRDGFYRVSEAWMRASFNPLLYNEKWLKYTTQGKEISNTISKIQNVFRQIIEKGKSAFELGENNNISDLSSPVFINQMFEKQLNCENSKGFLDQDIVTETLTLSTGAYETIVFGTNWTLQLIAQHKDIQTKLREEINRVMTTEDKEITQEHVKNMKYLDMVVQESLRMYPPTPVVGRVLERDTLIGGKIVPKGTDILIFISGIHRNSRHWSDPDVFRPDRFDQEYSQKRHPFSYIPFSAGPRNCLGGIFALNEMKVLITSILRKYEIEPVHTLDRYHVNWRLVGGPNRNILMKFKQLHNCSHS